MAKENREEMLRDGERLLGEWQVAASTAPGELASFAGRSPAADLAIAERLGAVATEDSVSALRQLDNSATDKRVRKEVRRALYRLEQRGVAIPPAPVPPTAAVLATPMEGYVSTLDGAGDQLVWIVKPRASGLAHMFAIINDPVGLREVELNVITRKALRSLRDELKAKHEIVMVAADWRYCDFLMHRAFRWSRAKNTAMMGDYPALRAQLTKEPAPENLPPLVLSRIAAVEADASHVDRSADLLGELEFRTWFLDPEVLRPYLDELAKVKDSPIVLSPEQQLERLENVIRRASLELFQGEQRDSYVRRLHEIAYFFAVTSRVDRAKQALAVALTLARSVHGGQDIPFCETLVRNSLHAFFEVELEQEAERAKTSLLVTPRQFVDEQRER